MLESSAEIDKALLAAGNRFLLPRGFSSQSARLWVRCRIEGIRDVIGFKRERGGIFWGWWGFHLDGIPIVRGDRICRPKLESTRDIHLRFDPYDVDPEPEKHNEWTLIDLLRPTQEALVDVRALKSRIIPSAEACYGSVRSWSDVPPHFDRKKTGSSGRYSWSLCSDLGMSHAFTLLHLNKRAEAIAAYLEWEACCSGRVHTDYLLEKARKCFVRAVNDTMAEPLPGKTTL